MPTPLLTLGRSLGVCSTTQSLAPLALAIGLGPEYADTRPVYNMSRLLSKRLELSIHATVSRRDYGPSATL